MKKQFWFVALFGFWCFLSALWYFLSVKGVITDPKGFNPQTSFVAILEILVMLLVACLLGYAIAWYVRSETINNQGAKVEILETEVNALTRVRNEYQNQVELWREKNQHDIIKAEQKYEEVILENRKLQKQKHELELIRDEIKAEKNQTQKNWKQAEVELETLKFQIRQIEFKIKEAEEENIKLKSEIADRTIQKEKTSVSDHPFVRSFEHEHKDDLTKIKGIGPFIEKRLNMIGIYSFQQLAELSPEMIDRVGAAIEFFPYRIVRDNWVGQAIQLAK